MQEPRGVSVKQIVENKADAGNDDNGQEIQYDVEHVWPMREAATHCPYALHQRVVGTEHEECRFGEVVRLNTLTMQEEAKP